MRSIFFFSLILLSFAQQAAAQEALLFPKGELSTADNHTGKVWLAEINKPDSILNLSLAQAVFAPGAKLDWHIHPAGQYLLITEGTGYYQEKDKAMQVVRKGDVVQCLPGVEHWHGASPGSGFAYIGITPTQKGKTVWLKRVTADEYNSLETPIINITPDEELKALSKKKWDWMADKKTDSLAALFHAKSMFVHMGGTWGKEQELNVIQNGSIWYKKADVFSVTVNTFDNTAIVVSDIDLLAVVGGNEVINPFMVTEVYVKESSGWKMGSLTFSKLTRPVKMNK